MQVAVVGAGPIGSWLAAKLSGQGEDVTLFEQKSAPGGKACSCLVSERIWNFIPRNNKLVENRIESVLLHFRNGSTSVKFKPGMLAIGRDALDECMVSRAKAAGANVRFGTSFIGMHDGHGSVILSLKSGSKTRSERFDRVIGCDGANSAVRTSLKIKTPRFRLGLDCFQKAKGGGKEAEIWPTKRGFFWKIPRGKNVEWGLFEGPQKANAMWKEFARDNGISGLKMNAATVPCGAITTSRENIVLCGDAAGLTKPWSGGGIIWGLTAAEMLAGSWPDFRAYESRMKKNFVGKIRFGTAATALVTGIGRVAPGILPNRFDADWLI